MMSSASASESLNIDVGELPLYRVKLLLNLVPSTLANALGLYLIVRASPKHIRVYRWFLLNILACAFLLDLYFMVMLQPFILLPVPGYCTLGLMQFGGTFVGGYIALLILFVLLGACACSILSAALYRLLAGYNLHHKMVSTGGLSISALFHLLLTAPIQLMAAFVISDIADQQTQIRAELYRDYTGLRTLLDSDQVCAFTPPLGQYPLMQRTTFLVIAIMSLVGLLGLLIIVMGFYSLVSRKQKLSSRLYQMHLRLSLSLLAQLAVPGLTLYLPFFLFAVALFLQVQLVSGMFEVYAFLFSLHSTLNAVAMILCTASYRQAVLRWLSKVQGVLFKLGWIKNGITRVHYLAERPGLTAVTRFGANALATELRERPKKNSMKIAPDGIQFELDK